MGIGTINSSSLNGLEICVTLFFLEKSCHSKKRTEIIFFTIHTGYSGLNTNKYCSSVEISYKLTPLEYAHAEFRVNQWIFDLKIHAASKKNKNNYQDIKKYSWLSSQVSNWPPGQNGSFHL